MIASRCASSSSARDAMEQLEEDLTCPICCGLFEDPRVLLCSHSFCKRCLEGLLEGSRGGAAFRAPLKCPACRKETPHNGAGSLQVNYTLRGIVEKYSRIVVTPRTSVCTQHRGQPLNMFCATDSELICGFCATTDRHRGHEFCSLEEAYGREKEAFEELFRVAESWRSAEALSRLETLRSRKKRALQSVTEDAAAVADYFDKLIGSLEGKKNELLADLETLKLATLQAHDPEIAQLDALMEERRDALALAESFRSVTDPARFLQHMQEFREKLRVFGETPPPSRRDVDAGPPVRDFDVKQWDSLRLREVDRIAVPHERVARLPRRGPRRCAPRWVLLLLLLLLVLLGVLLASPLLLLPWPLSPAAFAPLQSLAALSAHLGALGALGLQRVPDAWSRFTCAAQERVVEFIESAVAFIDVTLND